MKNKFLKNSENGAFWKMTKILKIIFIKNSLKTSISFKGTLSHVTKILYVCTLKIFRRWITSKININILPSKISGFSVFTIQKFLRQPPHFYLIINGI